MIEAQAIYPFVPSYVDLGIAKAPRLAMCWHMAEGGGTVGYLAKPNPNGVSVHFVIEYSGRIVQMLKLDHMHSSIRTSAIRTDDDSTAPYYGATAARAVMGKWADTKQSLGPNHASIGVEIEGFAKDGPNSKQSVAIDNLAGDMAGRFPSIGGQLGHRDFNGYKPCPGKKFPWGLIGGHGIAQEASMDWYIKAAGPPGTFTSTTATGAGWIEPDTFKIHAMPPGQSYYVMCPIYVGGQWNTGGYLCSDGTKHGRIVLAGDGTFVPQPSTGDVKHSVKLSLDGQTVYDTTV